MRNFLGRPLALLLLVACLTAMWDGMASAQDVKDIERRALEARRSIRSIHVVFRHSHWDAEAVKRGIPLPPKRYETWLDGDRLRVDAMPDNEAPANGPAAVGSRITMGRNWPKPGQLVKYTYLRSPVEIAAADGPQAESFLYPDFIDPRLLGFSLNTLLNLPRHGLEADVGSPRRKDVRVEKSALGAEEAWLVRARTHTGADLRLWLLPGKGYNVGRIQASGRTKEGNDPWVYSSDIELAKDPVSGVWFPKKVAYKRTVNGVEVTRETIDVVQAELNRDIDPQVFTLAGMNLPVGAPVMDDTGGKPKYWNGHGLGTASPVAPPESPPPLHAGQEPEPVTPTPVGIRWWYVVAAALFAAVAVLLFWWGVIRRAG